LAIGLESLSLAEALKAIDLDAITFLLGMIIVNLLRVSGFFELAARFALRRAQFGAGTFARNRNRHRVFLRLSRK